MTICGYSIAIVCENSRFSKLQFDNAMITNYYVNYYIMKQISTNAGVN